MRVLVDTSVWSEALRRRTKPESDTVRELRSLILKHRVENIGPIRQKILSGLREEAQFEKLEKQIAAFPCILLETADHRMAAKCFNNRIGGGVNYWVAIDDLSSGGKGASPCILIFL